MGVWIEIIRKSHPIRNYSVTLFMGVWIEISALAGQWQQDPVTPFMGVWIEIGTAPNPGQSELSHPLWVCGLKYRVLR